VKPSAATESRQQRERALRFGADRISLWRLCADAAGLRRDRERDRDAGGAQGLSRLAAGACGAPMSTRSQLCHAHESGHPVRPGRRNHARHRLLDRPVIKMCSGWRSQTRVPGNDKRNAVNRRPYFYAISSLPRAGAIEAGRGIPRLVAKVVELLLGRRTVKPLERVFHRRTVKPLKRLL